MEALEGKETTEFGEKLPVFILTCPQALWSEWSALVAMH